MTPMKLNMKHLLALAFAFSLIAEMLSVNLDRFYPSLTTGIPITDSVAATTIGAEADACGALFGLAVAVGVAAVTASTVGIGGAIAISVAAHVAAYYCFS
jgi:hypothetical protein